MNADQRDVIDDALAYYAGWFDENDPEDKVTLDEIEQAQTAKDPFNFEVTDNALQNYQEYLSDSLEATDIYDNDDLDVFEAKIQIINDLYQPTQLVQPVTTTNDILKQVKNAKTLAELVTVLDQATILQDVKNSLINNYDYALETKPVQCFDVSDGNLELNQQPVVDLADVKDAVVAILGE